MREENILSFAKKKEEITRRLASFLYHEVRASASEAKLILNQSWIRRQSAEKKHGEDEVKKAWDSLSKKKKKTAIAEYKKLEMIVRAMINDLEKEIEGQEEKRPSMKDS